MNYTKENFIKGEFAFINDGSKELEYVLKEWFPEDKAKVKDYVQDFIYFKGGTWDISNNFNGTTIKASEINNHKEWLGSELEYYNVHTKTWINCESGKYRLKQLPDHTAEIQRLTKEMNVTVKIEKL